MRCNYKNSLQVCRGGDDIEARFLVTVFYKDGTLDKLFLCTECTKYVTSDARRYRYEWEAMAL